jgi:hypothetical protein
MRSNGEINRARRAGLSIYCSRACSGISHRKHKTREQKVAEKAAYDAEYRAKNRETLKAKKHNYFKATYDPAKAAEARRARMPFHVEYCRRPEYRVKKRQYDRQYRADKQFAEFSEAFLVLMDLEKEIASRMSRYEIYQANGTLNKILQRRKLDGRVQR